MMRNSFKKVVCLALCVCMLPSMSACGKTTEKQSPIVILGAMDSEYLYLTENLTDSKKYIDGNFTIFEGTYKDYPVIVINCLVGMVNAGSATMYAIDKYNPEMVIIQGTAGGHDPQYHQGDIIIGKDIVEIGNYYSQHRDLGTGITYENREYPGAKMLVNGQPDRKVLMHSTQELVDIAMNIKNEYGIVEAGTHGSADLWNKEMDYINFCYTELGSDCEEMESFAVGQVCDMFNVPFISIRIISNSEWYPEEEFSDDFGIYCQKFTLDFVGEYLSK